MTIPFFDGHNDFLLRLYRTPEARRALWLGQTGKGHLDLGRMKEAGFSGGLFAIFVPSPSDGPPQPFSMPEPPYAKPLPPLMDPAAAQPPALAMAGLLHWMERAAPEDFRLCRSAPELRATIATGRIAALMHLEGAEAIGPDLDALYLFHEMGLRSLGPVWSRPTIFGHGVPMAFPGSPDTGPGLTGAGKDLVRLCDDLGIMIDLSHLNEQGFDDVARQSRAPLVATHSNAHAICPSTRNLTDRQLHMIRERGGMVGLNFATFFLNPDGRADRDRGFEAMLRHLDHLITHLGEDRVGLGSDFDGCTIPEAMGDVTGVPHLFEAMAAQGFDADLVGKLAMGNWLSCLDRCLR